MAITMIVTAQPRYNMKKLQHEVLNRGVVAVKSRSGKVFVTWRTLSTDKKGEAFTIYRNGELLTPKPLTIGATPVTSLSGGMATCCARRSTVLLFTSITPKRTALSARRVSRAALSTTRRNTLLVCRPISLVTGARRSLRVPRRMMSSVSISAVLQRSIVSPVWRRIFPTGLV